MGLKSRDFVWYKGFGRSNRAKRPAIVIGPNNPHEGPVHLNTAAAAVYRRFIYAPVDFWEIAFLDKLWPDGSPQTHICPEELLAKMSPLEALSLASD